MSINKIKLQKGSVMVFSLIVLSVILAITFSILGVFIPKIKTIRESANSMGAIFAADSIMEWCVYTQRTSPGDSELVRFPFDEGSGLLTYDTSGTSRVGDLVGAGVTWTTGVNNSGLAFNGLSGQVLVGPYAALSMDSTFTFEAWVNPTNVSGERTVFYKETLEGGGYYWFRIVDGQIGVGFKNSSFDYIEHYGGSVPINTWTHIAAVFDDDADTVTIYQDGIEVAVSPETDHPQTNADDLRIGQSACFASCPSNPYERWQGAIDDVRIYKGVALSQGRIIQDMNLAVPTTTPTPTPTPASTLIMNNGATYDIYYGNGSGNSDCTESGFDHRAVGTYGGVSRSLEVGEVN